MNSLQVRPYDPGSLNFPKSDDRTEINHFAADRAAWTIGA